MKFNMIFRWLIGISSLAVIASYFLPLWEIYLWAPQYPEGLAIQIWHNDLKGDVEVINGLNHYIGMKHLKVEMFPEFGFLKYIIAAFIAFGLTVAITGSTKLLKLFCVTMILGGIVALADFYRWGYEYGHNLDPTAPIQVPGMAYQPPVIGYKDLLNFTALSTPASGAWIIIAVGAFSFGAWFTLWLQNRKLKNSSKFIITLIISSVMTSCGNSIPELKTGKDDCSFCKMKLSDPKFGLVWVTGKGREYKFDDYHCYSMFRNENTDPDGILYVMLFDKPGQVSMAQNTYFVNNDELKSPMGSNTAFFTDKNAAEPFLTSASLHGIFNGKTIN